MRLTSFLLSGLLSVGLVTASPVAIQDGMVVRQEPTSTRVPRPRPTGSYTGTFSFTRPTGPYTGTHSRRPRPTVTPTDVPTADIKVRQEPTFTGTHSRRPRPTGSFTGSFSRPTGSHSRRPRPTVAPTGTPIEIEARQEPTFTETHSRRPRPTGSFTFTGSFSRPTGSHTRRPRPTVTPSGTPVELEARQEPTFTETHSRRPRPTGSFTFTGSFSRPTGSHTRRPRPTVAPTAAPVEIDVRQEPTFTGTHSRRPRPTGSFTFTGSFSRPTGSHTRGPRPTVTAAAAPAED